MSVKFQCFKNSSFGTTTKIMKIERLRRKTNETSKKILNYFLDPKGAPKVWQILLETPCMRT